jgi:hypothetical protein
VIDFKELKQGGRPSPSPGVSEDIVDVREPRDALMEKFVCRLDQIVDAVLMLIFSDPMCKRKKKEKDFRLRLLPEWLSFFVHFVQCREPF